MKRTVVFLAVIFAFVTAMAQDIIYTTDGQNIKARNIKFDGNSIRYSLYESSLMDRNTYMLDLNRVRMIKYENGHTFDPSTKSEPSAKKTTQIPSQSLSKKQDSRDTVFVYANVQPDKQLNSRLINAYPQYKNPAVAFAFSFVPGLGQFYNDEVKKGLWFMGIGIVSGIAFSAAYSSVANNKSGSNAGGAMLFSGLTLIVDYIWGTVDAVHTATRKNKENGYVVSLAPSMQYNSLAISDGGLGVTPSLSVNIAF